MEKQYRLHLDEASQELLETLQEQINEVETHQQQCDVADSRAEQTIKVMDDRASADRYELRLLIKRLQGVQEEHAMEMRLLRQEFVASKEFMAQKLEAIEQAVTCVRGDTVRDNKLQCASMQNFGDKINDLDNKLFALDKELLKLKLKLPASLTDHPTAAGSMGIVSQLDLTQGGDLNVRLQKVVTDLEAMKADSLASRSVDRKQFDALSIRLRETLKNHHTLKRETESRLQDVQAYCDQITTKIPSELLKCLQKAQTAWNNEIESLKASVRKLETNYTVLNRKEYSKHSIEHVDTGQQVLSDRVKKLQKEVTSLRMEHSLKLTRVDADLVNLFDWTRAKGENLTVVAACMPNFVDIVMIN